MNANGKVALITGAKKVNAAHPGFTATDATQHQGEQTARERFNRCGLPYSTMMDRQVAFLRHWLNLLGKHPYENAFVA